MELFCFTTLNVLEGMALYAGELIAPEEGFGLCPFWPILSHFWCSVVTLVTFSSNLNNYEKIPQNSKLKTKNPKI